MRITHTQVYVRLGLTVARPAQLGLSQNRRFAGISLQLTVKERMEFKGDLFLKEQLYAPQTKILDG